MSTIQDKLRAPGGTIFIHEILKETAKLSGKQEKINLLNAYMQKSPANAKLLQFFVEATFHPAVVFELPPGTPPYNQIDAADETLAYSTLTTELRNIRYFCKGPGMIENQIRRERQFVQTLEKLCPHEARLLVMIKDKKLDGRVYPGLTLRFFKEAFPQWFPVEEETKKA